MSALNIVQLFTTLIVVIVVQHCSCPNLAKQGVWSQIFARAASGGAQSEFEGSDPKIWRIFEVAMSVNFSSGKQISAFSGPKLPN